MKMNLIIVIFITCNSCRKNKYFVHIKIIGCCSFLPPFIEAVFQLYFIIIFQIFVCL